MYFAIYSNDIDVKKEYNLVCYISLENILSILLLVIISLYFVSNYDE